MLKLLNAKVGIVIVDCKAGRDSEDIVDIVFAVVAVCLPDLHLSTR